MLQFTNGKLDRESLFDTGKLNNGIFHLEVISERQSQKLTLDLNGVDLGKKLLPDVVPRKFSQELSLALNSSLQLVMLGVQRHPIINPRDPQQKFSGSNCRYHYQNTDGVNVGELV
ncbi:hypothetical protein BDDG_01123 [Blastomyces dermatitidis ATCC 18188]|uniref:Uncharacterized protein n=1 Tax=Ajellomyces dermatitidis (strain ATCC 18188 / CBS 674.68) TaxID=653446 RepID=F2T4W1_AJEDA|nr:hypothetical protein BDDG_01123 [Blastomyces dermatitidis ATCC 18188]